MDWTGRSIVLRGLAFFGLCALFAPSGAAEDLMEHYQVTLDHSSDDPDLLGWRCGPEDVWNLRSFRLQVGEQLDLRLSSATLVLGHSDGNAIWAVVLPKRKTKIAGTVPGNGEAFQDHVFLRFHPRKLGELFPSKTVTGRGDPKLRFWAMRVAEHKDGGFWSSYGRPVVPPERIVLAELDTLEGRRRAYEVDLSKKRVKYKGGRVDQAVPKPEKTNKKSSVAALEAAWKVIDEQYAHLGSRPEVDWPALRETYVKEASKARSTFQTGIAVHALLSHLGDDNVWLRFDRHFFPGYGDLPTYNLSWSGISAILGDVRRMENGVRWSETPYDVGYLWIPNVREDVVEEVDEALEELGDTWGLIIDLRFCQRGEEEFARQIAGRFLEEKTVYGLCQSRVDGDGYALGEREKLDVEPRGEWTYDAPISIITGQGTFGPGESLTLMLQRAVGGARTFGDRTAGGSLGAEWVELPASLSVYVPKRVDLNLEGEPFHESGLQPDEPIEADEDDFDEESDPVLYRTLEVIYQTPAEKRHMPKPDPEGETDGWAEDADAAEDTAEEGG